MQDMSHWNACTEIQQAQRGPLVVLQLGGLAREFAREIDGGVLANGGQFDVDGNGVLQNISGCMYLIWQLGIQFQHLRCPL